jgi:hypothetical protein
LSEQWTSVDNPVEPRESKACVDAGSQGIDDISDLDIVPVEFNSPALRQPAQEGEPEVDGVLDRQLSEETMVADLVEITYPKTGLDIGECSGEADTGIAT